MAFVRLNNGSFEINGKRTFILSGEVQYFRIPRENWQRIIDGLKEARCNTLSTYVPWNWHEFERGKYDFTGATHPSRDLVGFLNLVRDSGLNIIIKGGPHIHAEFLNGGVPTWVLSEHPEVLCLDRDGKPTSAYGFYPPITYLHPVYMKLVQEWFEAFMPIVRAYDNVILWQVDNEASYSLSFFHYGGGQLFSGDYNPFLVENGLYQAFLQEKYGRIETLNARYGESHAEFALVKPPRRDPMSRGEECKVYDWCEFRERLVGRYLRRLIEMLDGLGCRGPFSIDDPLLGYDTSWRTLHHEVSDPRWQVAIGYTYYIGRMDEEAAGHHLSRIEFTRASGSPLVSNHEMQAGDVYFLSHWKQCRSDYELIWKTAIGYGANMLNFYWFCDGENFLGYEHFLPNLDFASPLTKDGKRNFQFEIIRGIGAALEKHPEIVDTVPVYDLAVGYYHPYARSGKFDNMTGAHVRDLGKGAAIGSFIDLLGVCNINFQMLNVEEDLAAGGGCPEKLALVCHEWLGAPVQAAVLERARAGGHVILLGRVPVLDEDMRPCTTLKDALGVAGLGLRRRGTGFFEVNRVRCRGMELCVAADLQFYEFSGQDLAADATAHPAGEICGFTRTVGRGKISVLGFVPQVFMKVSREFARSYFGKDSRDGVLVYERRNGELSLFTVCNYLEEAARVPLSGSTFDVPPRSAVFVLKKGDSCAVLRE